MFFWGESIRADGEKRRPVQEGRTGMELSHQSVSLEVLLPRQFKSFLGHQRKYWKLKKKRESEKNARVMHQVFMRFLSPRADWAAMWKQSHCRPLGHCDASVWFRRNSCVPVVQCSFFFSLLFFFCDPLSCCIKKVKNPSLVNARLSGANEKQSHTSVIPFSDTEGASINFETLIRKTRPLNGHMTHLLAGIGRPGRHHLRSYCIAWLVPLSPALKKGLLCGPAHLQSGGWKTSRQNSQQPPPRTGTRGRKQRFCFLSRFHRTLETKSCF